MITRAHSLALLLLAAALRSATAQELVVVVESPVFTLDTWLVSGPANPALVVTAESPAFTLDTRLSGGNPILAALVVTAESAAFTLDTRLAVKPEYLIVQGVSLPFELNTMWLGLRKTALAIGSPLELYWPTNAPGFYPQSALPPLRPSMQWQDMTNSVSESGGYYRSLLAPEGSERYFRLKL